MEIAHFANADSSRKFEAEFRSYLVPGAIDGPELTPEVVKLEGLSSTLDGMGYWEIVRHMSKAHAIAGDTTDWHLHRPEAEREAQARLESVDMELY